MSNKRNTTAKPGILPKLRFSEFQREESWEIKLLFNVAYIIAGQSPEGENYNDKGIGLPFYQGKTDFGDIYLCKPTKWTTQVTKIANSGNILMSVRAPVGALNISTDKICIGRGLASIQAKKNKWFLYYFLSRVQKHIVGNGGAIFDSINKDQIEKISISIPKSIKEQQKIADCLFSLDELIAAERKKLDTLKDHKKGLMQQLFPVEGEALPKLRFTKLRDKWTIKRVGQLGQLIGGGTPSKAEPEYWQGNIPWISSSDIFEDDTRTITISKFINYEAIAESATKIVPKGSVLFVSRVGTGKLAVTNQEICTSQDFTNFFSKIIYNQFIAYYFSANKSILVGLGQGTSIKGFSKNDLENLKVCFPQVKEQQKIADCLSSIDDLLVAQSRKIDALRNQKKGLMQQLFPSMNEMQK